MGTIMHLIRNNPRPQTVDLHSAGLTTTRPVIGETVCHGPISTAVLAHIARVLVV
jgi:hypothetical protein